MAAELLALEALDSLNEFPKFGSNLEVSSVMGVYCYTISSSSTPSFPFNM